MAYELRFKKIVDGKVVDTLLSSFQNREACLHTVDALTKLDGAGYYMVDRNAHTCDICGASYIGDGCLYCEINN